MNEMMKERLFGAVCGAGIVVSMEVAVCGIVSIVKTVRRNKRLMNNDIFEVVREARESLEK